MKKRYNCPRSINPCPCYCECSISNQSICILDIIFASICRGLGRRLLLTWSNSAVHTSREWCILLTRLRKALILYLLFGYICNHTTVTLYFVSFFFLLPWSHARVYFCYSIVLAFWCVRPLERWGAGSEWCRYMLCRWSSRKKWKQLFKFAYD